jgi:replicative DNA helicase
LAASNNQRKNGNSSNRNRSKESDSQSVFNILGSKVPPHSIEAEMSVLGAMMLDDYAITKVSEIIKSESFYIEKHRIIYEAMMAIKIPNAGIDIITLGEKLRTMERLEFIGGTYYLIELMSTTPTAANIEYHAQIVQERYLKRLMIQTAGNIIYNCYEDSSDAFEEIDRAESEIFKIAEEKINKSYVPLNDLAHQAFEMIEQLKERDQPGLSGVPSGYTELDAKTGGFQKSDLIILAGRPSMGKTALALSIARNAAKEYKIPVAFFSIEMSAIQLVIRLISAEAKIDQQKIRTGRINNKDTQKIIKTLGRLSKAPMIIDDSPILSLMELRAKCRRMRVEYGIELVIVDYLQLMHPPKAESREREISILSRSLKQLAKELNIPIIALAQLNRSVESRTDKRPLLSDLRESGSIEQDADVVLFVNRPEQYGIMTYDDKSSTEGTAEIIVGKQRNGPTGIAKLAYVKDYARFENLAYDIPPEIMERGEDNDPGF